MKVGITFERGRVSVCHLFVRLTSSKDESHEIVFDQKRLRMLETEAECRASMEGDKAAAGNNTRFVAKEEN